MDVCSPLHQMLLPGCTSSIAGRPTVHPDDSTSSPRQRFVHHVPFLMPLQVLLMPWLALVHLARSHLLLLVWGTCAVFAPLALVLRFDLSWGSRQAGPSSSVGPPTTTRSAPAPTPGGAPGPHPAQSTTTRPPAARHHAATEHTMHTQLLVLVRLLSCTAAAAWLRAAPALDWGGLQQPGVMTPLVYLWSCWQASLLLVSAGLGMIPKPPGTAYLGRAGRACEVWEGPTRQSFGWHLLHPCRCVAES